MRSLIVASMLYLFGITAVVAAGSRQTTRPDCVTKCWVNTQYVSTCNGDTACLCSDTEFQNAVYQCLYSQCQTAQFGMALHHALGLCANKEHSIAQSSTIPALIRQDNIKKRHAQTAMQSVSASAYNPTSTSRGQQSVSASNYMTQSVSRASPTMRGSPKPSSSPAYGSPTPKPYLDNMMRWKADGDNFVDNMVRYHVV